MAKKVEPVYKMARDLEIDAKQLMGQWSRSNVIPKSSVAAVKTIMDQAKVFSYAIAPGTIAEIAKVGAQENKEGTRKNREQMLKLIASVPAMLNKVVADIRGGISVAEWDNFWSQNVRAIGTLLPQVRKAYPAADNAIKAFQKYSNKRPPAPTNQNQLNGWLAEISNAAAQIRQQMAQA